MRRFFNREFLVESKAVKEWIYADGTPVNNRAASQPAASTQQTTPQKVNKNIVTIVYDSSKHKLRAQADDGVHGIGNVAFPNNLRNKEGQQYEVETLIWNGKNYRASGNITPVTPNVKNINEGINKENYEMSFQSILEELDRLYDEKDCKGEACNRKLKEDADDEVLVDDETIEDDEEIEIVEDTPKQVVLECSNCGALVIKDEADANVDEKTDLVDIDETCKYCEEAKGFKIIGTFTPYESAEVEEAELAEDEPIEESVHNEKELEELLDLSVPVNLDMPIDVTANGNEVVVGGATI